MRLLEHEAKTILGSYNIPIPRSFIIKKSNSTIKANSYPVVIKSQVPTGGRGKCGGIQIAHNLNEGREITKKLFSLPIKNYLPNTLLAEEYINIDRELYLSIIINREHASIDIMAHSSGGVEIESQNKKNFFKESYQKNTGFTDKIADFLEITDKTYLLEELINSLYNCFIKEDATFIEINPLILTKSGQLIAGDCKMELDNAAAFRHPEWDFEEKPAPANFVTLNPHGTVATIANGAGLAMATVDAVTAAGYTPANFLDIGGTATVEKIVDSFTTISTLCDVKAIVINIFGGIVRCDNIARAIITAQESLPSLPPLYIRLSGNHSQEAANLLCTHRITFYDSLEMCLTSLQKEVSL